MPMQIDHEAARRAGQHQASSPRVGGLTADLTSLADVVDRLFTEFASHLSLNAVVSTIRRCRRDLDIVPEPALPELVERLARQRLHDRADPGPSRPAGCRDGIGYDLAVEQVVTL